MIDTGKIKKSRRISRKLSAIKKRANQKLRDIGNVSSDS